MSDTTKKTNVKASALNEKDQAYQDYMTAFRHAQEIGTEEAQRAALEKYNRYVAIAKLYEQARKLFGLG